jgi:hypothetical protein
MENGATKQDLLDTETRIVSALKGHARLECQGVEERTVKIYLTGHSF